jgi:hypothetical protein
MSIWKKTLFWGKVKDTLAIGSILSQGGMELGNVNESVKLWIGLGSLAAYLVGMWMDDKNKDGIVDIFETEVTTKITSDTPITVETTKTTDSPKQ